MQPKKQNQGQNRHDDIKKALKSSDIDNIYFNEFALGISKSDMFILIRRNGKEEAILNVSHITAKSLALALNEAIDDFEKKTGQKIMNSEDIEKSLDSSD